MRREALALPRLAAALDGYTVALVADLHAGAGHMTPARVRRGGRRRGRRSAPTSCCCSATTWTPRWLGARAGAAATRWRAELARLPGAVAVLGNHDWRAAGPAMGRALEAAGRPRAGERRPRGARRALWVAGTAEYRYREPDVTRHAARTCPPDAAVLLMIHDPDLFPRVPARVALTVAGHLHGGQVNVPLLRRAMLPTRYGERYLAGHVVEDGRHLYVSAGLGTSGPARPPPPPAGDPAAAARARAPRPSGAPDAGRRQQPGRMVAGEGAPRPKGGRHACAEPARARRCPFAAHVSLERKALSRRAPWSR